MFITVLVILNGISDGSYQREDQLLVLIGWLTWMVASDCMSELPHTISEEAHTGTLEQVCLVPIPLASLLAVRSLAYLVGVGIKGLLAVILAAFFIAPLVARSTLLVLFLISLVGAYGLVSLSLHSVGYFLIGLSIFTWGFTLSRKSGSLAHY